MVQEDKQQTKDHEIQEGVRSLLHNEHERHYHHTLRLYPTIPQKGYQRLNRVNVANYFESCMQ